jgi:hypothetical protein
MRGLSEGFVGLVADSELPLGNGQLLQSQNGSFEGAFAKLVRQAPYQMVGTGVFRHGNSCIEKGVSRRSLIGMSHNEWVLEDAA